MKRDATQKSSTSSVVPMATMVVKMVMMVMVVMMVVMNSGAVLGQDDQGREPPSITDPQAEATLYQKKDTEVTVKCEASGTQPITYQWNFQGSPVTPTNPPGGKASYDANSGTLTITQMTASETGRYRCLATNSFTSASTGQVIEATAMSQTVSIHLSYVDPWTPTPRPPEEGTEGLYKAIYCDGDLPAYDGPTEFKWYRRSTSQNFEVVPNERIFIDKQGTLHFSFLKSEDDANNYPYSCALSNSQAGTIVMGARIDLQIFPGNMIPTGPTLQYPNNTLRRYHVNATKDSTALLECFFSGYAPGDQSPTVSWTDNGNNPIVSGGKYQLRSQGRILEIRAVAESDEGDYFCQGELNGVETMGVKIMLNVTSRPVWDPTQLQSQTLTEGKTAMFHCKTRSLKNEQPPGPPVWFRNGKHLQADTGPDAGRWALRDRNMTLMITDVRKDTDIACYQCIVSNSEGETFGSGCLNVILPIEIVARPEAEQVVSPGDRINLTVVGRSDPLYALSYEWTFRNVTYKGDAAPPNVFYDSVTKLAYMNTTGFSSAQMRNISGVYKRRLFHPHDSVNVDTIVKLRADEIAVAGGFQYWIIGLILALILLLIILIICCCVLCRRKMQEGDYPVDKKEHAAGLEPEKEVEEGGFKELSRAHDPYQQKAVAGDLEGMSIKDESSFGSADYDFEPTEFNEDGSFINAYHGNPEKDKDKDKGKGREKTAVENPAFNPQTPDTRENPRYNPNNNPNNRNNNNNMEPLPPRENRPPPAAPEQQRSRYDEPPREIIPRYQNVPSPTRQSADYSYPNGRPWENPAFNPNESAV